MLNGSSFLTQGPLDPHYHQAGTYPCGPRLPEQRGAIGTALQNSLLRLNIITSTFPVAGEGESPLGPALSGTGSSAGASHCSAKGQGRAEEVPQAPSPRSQHCEILLGLLLDVLSAILFISECAGVCGCVSATETAAFWFSFKRMAGVLSKEPACLPRGIQLSLRCHR